MARIDLPLSLSLFPSTDPLRTAAKPEETERQKNKLADDRYGASNCFLIATDRVVVKIAGYEESSSSPVVRTGDGVGGSGGGGGGGSGGSGPSSSARKKKYTPNEQGRYVCTQCGRSYAAYHVNFSLSSFRIGRLANGPLRVQL